MQTNDFENVRVRIYQGSDPDLYTWLQKIKSNTTTGNGTQSEQLRQLLRAGLQAQNGTGEQAATAVANAPQATAAIDTEELLAALLPEVRAVVSAALATANVTATGPAEPPAEEPEDTAKRDDFLANLMTDEDLFLED